MKNNKINKEDIRFFFDMDNTICDMSKGLRKLNTTGEAIGNLPAKENKEIMIKIFTKDFFANLEPTPLLKTLVAILKSGYKVSILSGLPLDNLDDVIDGKNAWLDKFVKVHGDIEVNYVKSQGEKGTFTTEIKDILIDDDNRALNSWRESGGKTFKVTDDFKLISDDDYCINDYLR